MTGNTDYSSRDKDARLTFYVLLWKRRGITLEQFDDYWRDVHGPVCARLPGQFQYWQYHVAHNEGGLFPAVEGVDGRTADEDQFDGIAELTFRSIDRSPSVDRRVHDPDGRRAQPLPQGDWIHHRPGKLPDPDRRNRGRRPKRGLGAVKFHVLVRKADQVGLGDFRAVHDRAVRRQRRRAALTCLKFRLHLFEPLDTGRPEAAGVVHDEPPEKQYHAAFEIGFRKPLEMEAFFASETYAAVAGELPNSFRSSPPSRSAMFIRSSTTVG